MLTRNQAPPRPVQLTKECSIPASLKADKSKIYVVYGHSEPTSHRIEMLVLRRNGMNKI